MKRPLMGAEDFSYVLHRTAGAMVFLGAAPEGGDYRTCCALHSNRMMLDESVMARGIAMHCAMAEARCRGIWSFRGARTFHKLGVISLRAMDGYQPRRLRSEAPGHHPGGGRQDQRRADPVLEGPDRKGRQAFQRAS